MTREANTCQLLVPFLKTDKKWHCFVQGYSANFKTGNFLGRKSYKVLWGHNPGIK